MVCGFVFCRTFSLLQSKNCPEYTGLCFVKIRTAKAVDRNHGCLMGNMFQQLYSSSFQISDIYKFVLLDEFIILLSDLSYQKLIMMAVITVVV